MMGMQTVEEIVDVEYSEAPKIDKEAERVSLMIKEATTIEELKVVEPHLKDNQLDLYTVKLDELKAKK
jgi:hypothetical protein